MGDTFCIWQNALIDWVNCLTLLDTRVHHIKELGDGIFFNNLLNILFNKTPHDITTDQANEEVTGFLKHEYPNYCLDAESCEMEDEVEITYISSLLLLQCVLKSQNKSIMEKMYSLNQETQIIIKNFFENILKHDGNVTRNILKEAINNHCNFTSPKPLHNENGFSGSPLIGFSTPKRPPIKDVFESPVAQKLKQLSDQRIALKRLQNDLEIEQSEKAEMQEELQQLRETTKKLGKQINEKNDEIRRLREEWLVNDSELHKKNKCGKEHCQENILKKEVKNQETYIASLHKDIDILQNERDLFQQKLTKTEHQRNIWQSKSNEYEALCEKLQYEVGEKECELTLIKNLCSELQSHIQETQLGFESSVEEDTARILRNSPLVRSPENLGQVVVDLQLQEKEEENKMLSDQIKKMIQESEIMAKQISDLECNLETARFEASSLNMSNLELEKKVDSMAAVQQDFEESQMKLNLLTKEFDHLQGVLTYKDAELTESLQRVQSLSSEINDLHNSFLESQKMLVIKTDKLISLDRYIEAIEGEKLSLNNDLLHKRTELNNIKNDYEILLGKTTELEAKNEEYFKQLTVSQEKMEKIMSEKEIITEELNNMKIVLLEEKRSKDIVSDELLENKKQLFSAIEERDILCNAIEVVGEEKNALQNTVQNLKSDLIEVESNKNEVISLYNASKTKQEELLALKIELDSTIVNLEKEKASINDALSASKTELLIYKEQQEAVIASNIKEIEDKETKVVELISKINILEEEINTLEARRNELKAELDMAHCKISELEGCNQELMESYNKVVNENETLKCLKISMDEKIDQLFQDKNSAVEELEDTKASLLIIQERNSFLTDKHCKELHGREEEISGLLKQAATYQNLLDEKIEEKNSLNRNLKLIEYQLQESEASKNKLLETHTAQIQETEENIKEVHKNALKVKTMLSRKIQDVEKERDLERMLRTRAEQLLSEEKNHTELIFSQVTTLMSEKKVICQLCNDLKSNICILQNTIEEHQKQKASKCLPDEAEGKGSVSDEIDNINAHPDNTETEFAHLLYDCKKKIPSKPWNLDPKIEHANVCISQHASSGIKQENECSISKLTQNSLDLCNDQSPRSEETDFSLQSGSCPELMESYAKIYLKKITSLTLSEVAQKLTNIHTELVTMKGDIIEVLKCNDSLITKLSNTEKRCTDLEQQCSNLTVANKCLETENEKLLKNIEALKNLESTLEVNKRELVSEQNLRVEIESKKKALELSHDIITSDLQKLQSNNEALNTIIEKLGEKINVLEKENVKLNQMVQDYGTFHLKCMETFQKFTAERKKRHSELEKLVNCEEHLKQKMYEFQENLKCINKKFETMVLEMSFSYIEFKKIERQKIELEELFALMDIEHEEISHNLLNFFYTCLKETEKIDNQNIMASNLGINDTARITTMNLLNQEAFAVSDTLSIQMGKNTDNYSTSEVVNLKSQTGLTDNMIKNYAGEDDDDEKQNGNSCLENQHQLHDLQLQINTLISGIEVAIKKCCAVSNRCDLYIGTYNTKPESKIQNKESFASMRQLSLKNRTNIITNTVMKFQNTVEKEAQFEVAEDGQNFEDSLDSEDKITDAVLLCERRGDQKSESLYSGILQLRLRLVGELNQKTTEYTLLHKQNQFLETLLKEEQDCKKKLENELICLRDLNKCLANDKEAVIKLKSTAEEKCSLLEVEVQKCAEIKHAYETLLEVNYKLQSENEDWKNKFAENEIHIQEKIKAVKQEYERKLDKLKAKMRVLYEQEIEKKMKESKEEREHLQAMCKLYKEKIGSYENDVSILKSQVWEIGDKLLMTEKEKRELEDELIKQQQTFLLSLGHQDNVTKKLETSSLDKRRQNSSSSKDFNTMDVIDESFTYIRKKSTQRAMPSSMGHMFNPEDEEGEVFNTTNLADLKAGRCVPVGNNKGRLSELQYRNSLCPPHLKSSYPAETQFHDPKQFKDDELKLGCAVDVDHCDSLSTSMLLPSDKQRKKDRGQTTYNKPGPPTPGKNGGRHSLQGTELTPRAPLRESNDGACVRKASTPSRLKSLFTNKSRRDENTPVTPRGRRLSNIFRKQIRSHQ